MADGPTVINEPKAEYALPEVTVSGGKIGDDLSLAPVSASALSSEDLVASVVREVRDLNGLVPNLHFWTFGNRSGIGVMNMRGLFNQNQADTAVTVYIDDVPYSDVHSFDHPLFDVERVEILRGPQGALFGRNTESGVINIVTKKPGNVWEGTINPEVGGDAAYALRAGVRGPLIENKLYLGVSGLVDGQEGAIKNVFDGGALGGRRTKSGNVQLRWTPTAELDVQFTAGLDDYDDTGGFWYAPMDKNKYRTEWLPSFYNIYGLPAPNVHLKPFEVYQDMVGYTRSTTNRQALRVAYSAPWGEVVSVTSRRYMELGLSTDADSTPLDFQTYNVDSDLEEWTQELLLRSPKSSTSWIWLLGGFFDNRNEHAREWYNFGSVYPSVLFGAIPRNSRDVFVDANFGSSTYAVFGQGTLRFFDDALGLTTGLRLEHVVKRMDRRHYFEFGGQQVPLAQGMPLAYRRSTDFTGTINGTAEFTQLLPRFALDYRLPAGLTAYASVAKGYKPGGFDYRSDNPAFSRFDAETCWTYEAGLKGAWLDKRVQVELAGFRTDVSNYQDIIAYDLYNISFRNVGSARIHGIEAQTVLTPWEGLSVTAGLGWLDGRYVDFTDPATGANYNGKTIVLTPEYNYTLGVQYRFPWGLFLRGEMVGFGPAYGDQANTVSIEAYTLFNARVGYQFGDMELYVFGKNLTNKEYFNFAQGNMGMVGTPRTVGVGVLYRF